MPPGKITGQFQPASSKVASPPSTSSLAVSSNPVSSNPISSNEEGLRHQLTAGQMAMVAVGGSIGTGLLLGSAAAIKIAGPAVILSFVAAAFIAWTVTMAMGELASAHPAAGAFGVYGDLYLNPWAGFMARASYWSALSISIGAEMVASATYMTFWFPSVPAWVWVVIFAAFLLLINLRTVGEYGRFEFWFSMIKVAAIAAFIVVGATLLFTRRVVPQYTAHGGFFPNGYWSPLIAMTFAAYSFGGVEMVAITSGESRSVKEIPRAVKLTVLILTLVYLGAIAVLVGVMPWNQAGVSESPFVTVLRTVGIPAASHIMNFVVLSAALSGSNGSLYSASRMLFSLARMGWAPARIGQLNLAGSPRLALLISSFGILVALVLEKWVPGNAFVYILSGAFTGLMIPWLVSLAAHIRFRKQLSPTQLAALPMHSPLGTWGSVVGSLLVTAAIFQTWYSSHVGFVSGVVYLSALSAAYFVLRRIPKSRLS